MISGRKKPALFRCGRNSEFPLYASARTVTCGNGDGGNSGEIADAVHGCLLYSVICYVCLVFLYWLKVSARPKSINFKLIAFRNLFMCPLAIYFIFNQFPCYDLLQPDVISYYFKITARYFCWFSISWTKRLRNITVSRCPNEYPIRCCSQSG